VGYLADVLNPSVFAAEKNIVVVALSSVIVRPFALKTDEDATAERSPAARRRRRGVPPIAIVKREIAGLGGNRNAVQGVLAGGFANPVCASPRTGKKSQFASLGVI
jgi:hypothetical protein